MDLFEKYSNITIVELRNQHGQHKGLTVGFTTVSYWSTCKPLNFETLSYFLWVFLFLESRRRGGTYSSYHLERAQHLVQA